MSALEPSLKWGAADMVPENVETAWGARLIVTQDGHVDIVPDRQDAIGTTEDINGLLDLLNASIWRDTLSRMLRTREVLTREGREVTVYEDDAITVRGSSHGSHGYFYVAAWLK